MRLDAEAGGPVWARANDDRVTAIGRFIRLTRLDELPQLWNVLVGHMSSSDPGLSGRSSSASSAPRCPSITSVTP